MDWLLRYMNVFSWIKTWYKLAFWQQLAFFPIQTDNADTRQNVEQTFCYFHLRNLFLKKSTQIQWNESLEEDQLQWLPMMQRKWSPVSVYMYTIYLVLLS